MENDTVLRRVPKRSLFQIFSMGVSAPVFLLMPPMEMRTLRSGETVRHAWESVGAHMSRSLHRIAGERRSS